MTLFFPMLLFCRFQLSFVRGKKHKLKQNLIKQINKTPSLCTSTRTEFSTRSIRSSWQTEGRRQRQELHQNQVGQAAERRRSPCDWLQCREEGPQDWQVDQTQPRATQGKSKLPLLANLLSH